MPLVEERITVSARTDEIFELISNFASYPDFMENVREVQVLEHKEVEGGEIESVTRWSNNVDGRVITWTERDHVKPASHRIDFELIEGDLKKYSGFWNLSDSHDLGGVEVNFGIYFEFGIPMLAPMLHPFLAKKLRQNMQQMLRAVKDRAEGDAGLQHG